MVKKIMQESMKFYAAILILLVLVSFSLAADVWVGDFNAFNNAINIADEQVHLIANIELSGMLNYIAAGVKIHGNGYALNNTSFMPGLNYGGSGTIAINDLTISNIVNSSALNIENAGNVNLWNFAIIGTNNITGHSSANFAAGATIYFSGNILFEDNVGGGSTSGGGPTLGGGAIATGKGNTSYGTNLFFDAVQFINNSTSHEFGNAGAIFMGEYTNASFSGAALFKNNKANEYGGAIMATKGSVVRYDGTAEFKNNEAVKGGGAIYTQESETYFNKDVVFDTNISAGSGGALNLFDSRAEFKKNALFSNNKAGSSPGMYEGGGAIYAAGSGGGKKSILHFIGIKTEFNNNTSANSGGALVLGGYGEAFFMEEVTFLKNKTFSVDQGGGAIAVNRDNNSLIFMKRVTFEENSSIADGGAMWITSNNSLINFEEPALFKSNTASKGGAIFAEGSEITFNESGRFHNNIASKEGGAVYYAGEAIDFNATTDFQNNKAGTAGGAIYAQNTSAAMSMSFGQGALFKNNAAQGSGGAVFMSGSADNLHTIVFKKASIFNGNIAGAGGGAMALGANTKITFEQGAVFESNRTDNDNGGGLAVYADILGGVRSEVVFKNETVSFIRNSAILGSGGGASIQKSDIIFETETTFELNSASLNGGGIFLGNASTADFKEKAYILDNAALNGGGMYFDDSSAKLKSANIYGNNATQNGGGFYINESIIEIDGHALFEGNIASGSGGAVYMEGSLAKNAYLTINQKNETSTNFENNTSNGNNQSIHMAGNSRLTFNIDENRSVYLKDGLTAFGNNNNIDQYGNGTFYLSGDMSGSNANLAVHDGIFKIEAGGKFAAGDVDIKTGAVFDIENGEADKIESKSFHAQGMLKIDVFADGTSDSIETEEEINIDGGISVLAGVGDYTNKRYAIAHAGAGVTGYFDPEEMHLPVNITHFFDYSDSDWVYLVLSGISASDFSALSPLSYNQKNIARVLDTISPAANAEQAAVIDHMNLLSEKHQKEALSQIAGYFLANVIKSQAGASERRSLYQNIEKRYAQENNSNANLIWAEVAGGERSYSNDKNSIGDFTDKTAGINFGWDNKNENMNLVYGAFGKYGNHSINQKGGNDADVDSFGAGIYGGHQTAVGIDIKAAVGISGQRYDTVRKIEFMNETAKATFNGMAVNADIEMGYKMEMSGSGINLRPFAGFEKGWVSNEEFKETGAGVLNLKVKNAKYKQSILRAGVGADGNLLDSKKLSWNASLEYGHIIDGEVSEIETVVLGSGEVASIRGSETGSSVGSVNVGADYILSESITAYCGIMYAAAESFNNYYGNAGIKVAF